MTQFSFSGEENRALLSVVRAAPLEYKRYLTYGSSCFFAASIASLYISHTIIPYSSFTPQHYGLSSVNRTRITSCYSSS